MIESIKLCPKKSIFVNFLSCHCVPEWLFKAYFWRHSFTNLRSGKWSLCWWCQADEDGQWSEEDTRGCGSGNDLQYWQCWHDPTGPGNCQKLWKCQIWKPLQGSKSVSLLKRITVRTQNKDTLKLKKSKSLNFSYQWLYDCIIAWDQTWIFT